MSVWASIYSYRSVVFCISECVTSLRFQMLNFSFFHTKLFCVCFWYKKERKSYGLGKTEFLFLSVKFQALVICILMHLVDDMLSLMVLFCPRGPLNWYRNGERNWRWMSSRPRAKASVLTVLRLSASKPDLWHHHCQKHPSANTHHI